MTFESVDNLQRLLAEKVFHYAKDAKKASGRALGTLVEIITFYLLKSWGFEKSVAIETSLPEYGNPDITHNVEFSLHPVLRDRSMPVAGSAVSITAASLLRRFPAEGFPIEGLRRGNAALLTKSGILRNSCVLARGQGRQLLAMLAADASGGHCVCLVEQLDRPYAMFECKRVGVEEGMRNGPQTIEKAKQGAYVAGAVSSLQKIRSESGDVLGVLYAGDTLVGPLPYPVMLERVIASDNPEYLRRFILTVGVVSNHGNWFTSDNHNKEMKVLAQSYDWLLFLTDAGLARFITEILLSPTEELAPARKAFLASYTGQKRENCFTKVRMKRDADLVLQEFFRQHRGDVETWFNVIAPAGKALKILRQEMSALRDKDWGRVHSI